MCTVQVVPQPVERAISQEDDADFDALWDSWDFDNSGELDQVELREVRVITTQHCFSFSSFGLRP